MSEMSREARRANRAKAHRLANAQPGKVDASDYGPTETLDADVATGMRPVSRRAYKAGGKVEGEKPAQNAGKMQRTKKADGGGTFRDQMMQTASLGGKPSLGGVSYKRAEGSRDVIRTDNHAPAAERHSLHGKTGKWKIDHKGRALPEWAEKAGPVSPAAANRTGRASGGKAVADAIANTNQKDANAEREGTKHVGGLKRGGRAGRDAGGEVPTTRFSVGSSGGSRMTQAAGLKTGGRAKRSTGGDIALGLVSPLGAGIKALSGGGDDKDGKKSGGSVGDGTFQGTRPTGGRMARKSGGRAGKTSINIIIGRPSPAASDGPGSLSSPSGGPGAQPVPVPVGPPGLGAMGAQIPGGQPPMAPPGAGAPPPMMPPPMPRKSGGRTMTAGAESGLGRLEKTAIAKKDRLG